MSKRPLFFNDYASSTQKREKPIFKEGAPLNSSDLNEKGETTLKQVSKYIYEILKHILNELQNDVDKKNRRYC